MPPDAAESSRGRVLLVDDDESVRLSVSELLRRRGFEVEVAASGPAALALLQAAPFEAIVADIQMPGNAGLELVETATRAFPGLPTILLTGRPSVETAARSVRLAVVAYLLKPPDLEELSQILDEAIARFRALGAIQAHRARLRQWDRELAALEEALHDRLGETETESRKGFFLVSLRQILLVLADLEKSVRAIEADRPETLGQVDHVAALRHTVQVLQRTKQNFKSKDLADLRKSLEGLLAEQG